MQIGIVEETQPRDQNGGLHVRKGGVGREIRRLLEDDAPDGFNFWFARSVNHGGEGAFESPRHKHTFQQIKFAESGAIDVTPGQYIETGGIGYFPRGAYYGPQRREDCVSLVVQYGFNGEHQRGHYWEDRRAEALERLNARGRIVDGVFIETDPDTGETKTRDSMDALYDERYQMLKSKPLTIPPPAYDAPILMHPSAFTYFEFGPGVELKYLGRFFDQAGPNGDVTISMLRLTGGTYALRADRPQIAWAVSPGLKVEGRTCPELTSIYSPRGEEGLVAGDDGIEVYMIEFPRLD
jgi:hypothetical protein